jgi:putative flippase GtrA
LIKDIFSLIKKLFELQLIKFLLTGGLNTLFGYLVFSMFTYFTGNPSLSVVLANMVGVLFNFKTYGNFVFNSDDNSKIYRFFGVYIFITISQIGLLKYLNYLGVVNAYLAAAIVTLPMALLSYLLLKRFVFRQNTLKDKDFE